MPSSTVTEWAEKWTAHREKKGLSSATRCLGCYEKWIKPVIGEMAMRRVVRRDVERVVEALDAAVVDGELSWKTAVNHWGVVTKMFSDSCRSKVLELRVRDDNPTREVEGPDRGGERSGPYLSPAEFLALVTAERVPMHRRLIYTLAIYTYTRRGELAVLTGADVNLDAGYILVHCAENYDTREVKPTKAENVRKVPIEATLRPLLVALVGKPSERLIDVPSDLAALLRADLKAAGITRAELFADNATQRPIDFHDLRHSGITWRAIRGDNPIKIMRAGGHSRLETTMIYVNEAETFDVGFGAVFPTLPVALASSARTSARFPEKLRKRPGNIVARVGFEPTTFGL